MSVTIRGATPGDAPAISALNAALTQESDGGEVRVRIEAIHKEGRDALFVAELDGAACGYIHVAPYDTTYQPHGAEVIALVVDARSRRSGAGSALMERAEQWARERGAAYIHLSSGADRADAHAFYEARGYTLRKLRKHYVKRFT